jgi:hypothetical protein
MKLNSIKRLVAARYTTLLPTNQELYSLKQILPPIRTKATLNQTFFDTSHPIIIHVENGKTTIIRYET